MNESGQKNRSISANVSGLKSTPEKPEQWSGINQRQAVAFVGSGGKTDQESLGERISNLENEYNLGLLLIEKKEWASKYDEFKEADALKSEQAVHLSEMPEAEKRVENSKKALLGVERQCALEVN